MVQDLNLPRETVAMMFALSDFDFFENSILFKLDNQKSLLYIDSHLEITSGFDPLEKKGHGTIFEVGFASSPGKALNLKLAKRELEIPVLNERLLEAIHNRGMHLEPDSTRRVHSDYSLFFQNKEKTKVERLDLFDIEDIIQQRERKIDGFYEPHFVIGVRKDTDPLYLNTYDILKLRNLLGQLPSYVDEFRWLLDQTVSLVELFNPNRGVVFHHYEYLPWFSLIRKQKFSKIK